MTNSGHESILTEFHWFWCQQKSGQSVKSKFFEQGLNNSSPDKKVDNQKEAKISIKPPPPPPAPLSPSATVQKSPSNLLSNFNLEATSKQGTALESTKEDSKNTDSSESQSTQEEDVPDDDFGDFQTAG